MERDVDVMSVGMGLSPQCVTGECVRSEAEFPSG